MGAVYQGYDAALDRRVAIKTLTSGDITDRESRERFEREARAAAKLQHPNIVTMYELGNFGKTERPYIVMEFLEGTDLAKAIREEPKMPLSEILDVTVQLCRALDFAHRHGVVHRDMKPANVRYLDNGQVKIMDFGIARLEGSKPITQSGVMVGTLQYMSPEQIRGKALDGRSDLFSLGCIVYEMLCGDRAFEGDSPTSILYHIVHDEPTPILEKNPDLPQELDGILRRAMAKDASERFPSGEAMALELEKLAAIHHKAATWSRPDIQKHHEELEDYRRRGNWEAALEKATEMLEQDPSAVAPYRALRQARRMLALRSSPADSSPPRSIVVTESLSSIVIRPHTLSNAGAEISVRTASLCEMRSWPIVVRLGMTRSGPPPSLMRLPTTTSSALRSSKVLAGVTRTSPPVAPMYWLLTMPPWTEFTVTPAGRFANTGPSELNVSELKKSDEEKALPLPTAPSPPNARAASVTLKV